MKTGKKILLTALSATLVVSLTSGLAITAFADSATKDHEFDAKSDVVFEDFDRVDITDTVKTEGQGVDLGERSHLHVEYTAGSNTTTVTPIYKQGSGSLSEVSSGGTITLTMRSPDSSVELSELYFGARGIDAEDKVLSKTFDQLRNSDNDPLGNITAEWKTFEISFANSYEDTDTYNDAGNPKVTETPLLGFHIYTTSEAEGTLDIALVEYSTTGDNKPLNEFHGEGSVQAMAQTADAGTWWADSTGGTVVKRTVKMTSGEFTVVKDKAVGKYAYAIIEAEGDVEHLKVATTADGTTWGTAAAYDGYSVKLTGTEKGFKFIYEGSAPDGVTVKRIYLTNNVIPVPAIAVPVIDAKTAKLLEDFSVAQNGFTGIYEDMTTRPEMEKAGLVYRMSYSNADKVTIGNGELVFDATELPADGYIDFKFLSKTAVEGKYVVLKMKTEDGATLDNFRFALGDSEDKFDNAPVYANQLKAGYNKAAALLDDSNPYKDGDWYYVVADIDESGFNVSGTGYSGLNLYYSGTGKLHIDEIFFCDAVNIEVPEIEKDYTLEDLSFEATTASYHYSGWLGLDANVRAKTLSFDVVPKADNFDISSLRFGIGSGTYWASENAQGTLLTTDGKKLTELTYTNGQATHVEIDLEKSGVTDCIEGIHIHRGSESKGQPVVMEAFDLKNIKVHCSTPVYEIKVIDYDNPIEVAEEKSFTPAQEGYEGAFGYGVPEAEYVNLEFTLVPGYNFSLEALRITAPSEFWFAQKYNTDGFTVDGEKLTAEKTFTKDQEYKFALDLRALGLTASFHEVFFHTAGTGTGSFKVKDFKLTGYVDYVGAAIEEYYTPKYQPQLDLLDTYLDNVAPTVDITTATTAKAGDQITVAYTVSDNATATKDLDITVSVTKDGNAVALTDNKFTAAEGVYTVTVTVRDLAGNEATDTIQITVSAKEGESSGGSGEGETPAPPADGSNCSGCGAMTFGGGMGLGGGTALLVISMLAVTHIIRRKKQN